MINGGNLVNHIDAKNTLRKTLIVLLLISIIISINTRHGYAQEALPVELSYIDNYDKTIKQGETADYKWALENKEFGQSYVVNISVVPSDTDWIVDLDKNFLLGPAGTQNGTREVTLSVTPPEDKATGSLLLTLTFKIKNDTHSWNIVATAETTILAKVLGLFDNPLPAPLNNNYGVFILDLIIWIVIILGIYFLIEVVIKRMTKKTKTELDDIVFGIIRRPVLVLLVLFAFITSLRALEAELPSWIYPFMDRVYLIMLVLIGLYVSYKLFKNIVVYYGKIYAEKTETDIDDVMIPVAEKLGAVIILIVGIAILLGYIGIDLTMLAVGSIVISMVIAFALQDTLANFFAGIYLLTDRPFKVGDWVILESEELCQVKQIGMRSVRLYKMFDHADLILPNNKIASQKILNITMPDEQAKVKIKLGVAYGTDIKRVKELLMKAAMEHPNVLKEEGKMPLTIFTDFGESSLDFLLIAWVDNIMNQWKVARELRESINEKFLKEDVEIPFPQRVVWHKDEDKIFTSFSHQKE